MRPHATRVERQITGGLRSVINDHGPVTKEWIGSAAKRIFCQLETAGAIGVPIESDMVYCVAHNEIHEAGECILPDAHRPLAWIPSKKDREPEPTLRKEAQCQE